MTAGYRSIGSFPFPPVDLYGTSANSAIGRIDLSVWVRPTHCLEHRAWLLARGGSQLCPLATCLEWTTGYSYSWFSLDPSHWRRQISKGVASSVSRILSSVSVLLLRALSQCVPSPLRMATPMLILSCSFFQSGAPGDPLSLPTVRPDHILLSILPWQVRATTGLLH